MALINYKSSQIRLNIPNKVLAVSVSSLAGESYWDYANGAGDLWYSGVGTKKYYRWTVTFSVTAQTHGSHLTRDDFAYNGLDIVVGDWIAGATSGQCLKIVSITSKTANTVTCVVEDWLRYNTFKSATGNGIFNTGSAVVFSLNENGLPLLDPLPGTVSTDFYPTVMSRFQYLNPLLNYVLEQDNHGFSKGDVIAVTANGFSVANTITMDKMIGTVIETGPGPNFFMISPNNRIIDFEPSIPGTQGDYIYLDTDGDLTASDTTGKIVFLKIQDAISTEIAGTVDNPTVPDGHQIALNGTIVTFAGTGGANANVNQMVSTINSNTSNHYVTASSVPTSTVITSDAANTIYGLVGGFVPFSAYISSGSGNTLINFTTDTGGQAAYGLSVGVPVDMAADINAANIANLTATATTTALILSEVNGNAITITNGNADVNSYSFVGTANVSGLPASTSATGARKLVLARSDGGEILIYEGTEFFRVGTGVASGHNGMYPLAMNIERGLRSAGTTVVANIAARDALTPQTGDQAYVLNAGTGEWGLYVYNGSAWVQVANADSATTDAKTLITTFTMPAVGFGNSTTNLLGNISPGRKITSVSFDVHTAFSGYSGNITPNIEVGVLATPAQFVASDTNDLREVTEFYVNPEYVYPASNSQDLQIRVRCNHYQSTSGNVTIKLTYV
jgi:hypothetical protein